MRDNAFDLRVVRGGHDAGDGSLLSAAIRMKDARRIRASLFGAGLFAEPSWDILLEVYIAQEDRRSLLAADICVDINAGWSSVMRWIRVLRSEGLIEGYPALPISENTPITLSRKGDEKMVAYLSITH
ncbi:hypothetical protein [Sphingobium boeckii]|uniref:Helix-turn-helix domain-containing protein n=1 Tax=Sphingobium boeckii TaxID=1082345 RepID=A0A7W9EG84_9SPHN|nr:hypothetical protein [Sphingobium boeckii]MBB5686481.1 hypothetical protein [Sphingobium boeckii]